MQQHNDGQGAIANVNPRVQDVLDLTRTISSTLDRDEVLQNTVEGTLSLFHADYGAIFIYDEDEGRLVPEYSSGFNWDYLRRIKLGPGECCRSFSLSGNERLFLAKDSIDKGQ